MEVIKFETEVTIPVTVTAQKIKEIKTTRHVEGYPEHYIILRLEGPPDKLESYLMGKYYERFQREAEETE